MNTDQPLSLVTTKDLPVTVPIVGARIISFSRKGKDYSLDAAFIRNGSLLSIKQWGKLTGKSLDDKAHRTEYNKTVKPAFFALGDIARENAGELKSVRVRQRLDGSFSTSFRYVKEAPVTIPLDASKAIAEKVKTGQSAKRARSQAKKKEKAAVGLNRMADALSALESAPAMTTV
jgi:hypothetical protein